VEALPLVAAALAAALFGASLLVEEGDAGYPTWYVMAAIPLGLIFAGAMFIFPWSGVGWMMADRWVVGIVICLGRLILFVLPAYVNFMGMTDEYDASTVVTGIVGGVVWSACSLGLLAWLTRPSRRTARQEL